MQEQISSGFADDNSNNGSLNVEKKLDTRRETSIVDAHFRWKVDNYQEQESMTRLMGRCVGITVYKGWSRVGVGRAR